MQPLARAAVNHLQILLQVAEIRRQQRWRNYLCHYFIIYTAKITQRAWKSKTTNAKNRLKPFFDSLTAKPVDYVPFFYLFCR
jgi:hypothetical protein